MSETDADGEGKNMETAEKKSANLRRTELIFGRRIWFMD
jgi:hypothetical protein